MALHRPSVFVASSAEALDIVEAIHRLLDHEVEVIPWTTIFDPSEYALESLVSRLDEYDFAIIVLTPDDVVESRGKTQSAPRDNSIFELGLFVGRLGRKRVFAVTDRTTSTKLPSDLAGVNIVTYQPPCKGNLMAALAPACAKMKNSIRETAIQKQVLG